MREEKRKESLASNVPVPVRRFRQSDDFARSRTAAHISAKWLGSCFLGSM
jgi:hypothetical protein